MSDLNKIKKEIIGAIGTVLIEKNKRYGNSALQPKRVFFKGESTDSILIRLDDKYSRVCNSETIRVNDMFDILGYLFLLSISKKYYGTNDENAFENNVKVIQNKLFSDVDERYEITLAKRNGFSKIDQSLVNLDNDIQIISETDVTEDNIKMTMVDIVIYFIMNNINNFEELID